MAGAGADQLIVHLGGFSLTTVTLTLTDPSGGAFEAGPGADFSSKEFRFVPLCVTGIGCAFNPSYSGTLTSLVSVPVPEPTSAEMMLLGGLGLAVTRQRRRRR